MDIGDAQLHPCEMGWRGWEAECGVERERIGCVARGGDAGPGRGGIFGHVVIFGSFCRCKCCV